MKLLYSLALFLILSVTSLYAQKTPQVIVLHPDIGQSISLEEKMRYEIIEFIPDKDYITAEVFSEFPFHYIEVLLSDNSKLKVYISEKELQNQIDKLNKFYDQRENDHIYTIKYYRKSVHVSGFFENVLLFNDYNLEGYGELHRKIQKKLSNRKNLNASYGVHLSKNVSMLMGINFNFYHGKEPIPTDSSYNAYYITRPYFDLSVIADPFHIREQNSFDIKMRTIGLSIGIKNYFLKMKNLNFYLKNMVVANFYNKVSIDRVQELWLLNENTKMRYNGTWNSNFYAKLIQPNFIYQSMLGIEIKLQAKYTLIAEMQLNYYNAKHKHVNNAASKVSGSVYSHFGYNVITFTPNLGISTYF